MKSKILLIIGLCCQLVSFAQSDNRLVLGTVDTVKSTILGEERRVWVYVPSNPMGHIFEKVKYPVMYLLDGDAHFYSVAGMIEQLSTANGNSICPRMIVVGITNTNRTRDLSPTHVDSDPPMVDSNFGRLSGGGENFISFIEKELIPYIDSKYPTQSYKMLVGHSLGGLMAIHTLINHTSLFNSYVAIDPSMWWHKEKLLNECKTILASRKFSNRYLYLGIANTLPAGMNVEKALKDTSSETRHFRSIMMLDKYLKANPNNGIKYKGKYYADDDHGSVPLITEYDALRFIFSYYPIKYTRRDYEDSSTALAGKVSKHYEEISRQFGYTVKPPEDMVNFMGYQFLRNGKNAKAGAFFKMNVDNYPRSANVYDSYGDYFEAIGDKTGAVEQYKKSLAILETPEARQKLDKMSGAYTSDNSAPDLLPYAGDFDLVGLELKIYVQKGKLHCFVPGQTIYEMVPVTGTTEFTIKDRPGYKILYNMQGGKPSSLTVTAPEGVYQAKPKTK